MKSKGKGIPGSSIKKPNPGRSGLKKGCPKLTIALDVNEAGAEDVALAVHNQVAGVFTKGGCLPEAAGRVNHAAITHPQVLPAELALEEHAGIGELDHTIVRVGVLGK